MNIIDFVSSLAMPLIIFIIILYGLLEKKKVFDLFLKGATDGLRLTIKIFPTLIGLFVAIGMLRTSGIIDLITVLFMPFLNLFSIPSEIVPLAILRPISGSASIAIATDIMTQYGTDTNIRTYCFNNYGLY